jgi:RNA polymerase sigma-70 factor (ECF subfamily)
MWLSLFSIMCVFAMVSVISDAELVERFKGGERRAFNEITRRYQNKVYGICFRWLGNEQIASEVAQDVFVSAFRALKNFRGESKLSTWLYRIAINHCKNRRLYQRRRHTHKHESLDKPIGDEADSRRRELPSEEPMPDASTHQSEAQHVLQAALEQLDEEQRFIIVLRDMEDRSYEEIAELLKLPRGTVKSRLHRARSQLAKLLTRRLKLEDVISQ